MKQKVVDAVVFPTLYSVCADDKKADIRSKVWQYLDKNNLSLLFPPYKKISNFKVAFLLIYR